MSDAVKVIDHEIKSVEQQLHVHSYHLYALRELRNKLVAETNKSQQAEIKFPHQRVEPLVLNIPDKPLNKKLRKKPAKHSGRKGQIARATIVADEVRRTGKKKSEVISLFIRKGTLKGNYQSIYNTISPSVLGSRTYNRIFAGTKYAKQA